MAALDYLVIVAYLLGVVGTGVLLGRRTHSADDMFAAGRRSPAWISGLSAFMTMFSAGTFVVWGGIAYRFGLVAIAISMCYGVAALAVGWCIAGRWRKLGVESAAEFLHLRYGPSLVQFYTWVQGFYNVFTTGGTVYALAVIICVLMPLPEGAPFRDTATGNLSVWYASLGIALIVTLICFVGGLWAVLVTDVLQFVVLSISVVFVVPLALARIGGFDGFMQNRPDGFFNIAVGDFSWWFLFLWIAIHFAKIGGEWAFVQRFTCVPNPKSAKRAAYIFGVMYLVSPWFWMLPPMIYRVGHPIPEGATAAQINVLAESAYINACQEVLPVGMIGLMIAAMMSATASSATTQLNVYAAAFTRETFQRLFNPDASSALLVRMGRLTTLLLGGLMVLGAYVIPRAGTYTSYIIAVTSLLGPALVLPTLWGLFSRRVGLGAAWTTTAVSFIAGFIVKFGLQPGGFLVQAPTTPQGAGGLIAILTPLQSVVDLANINTRVTDLAVGIGVPLIVLTVFQLLGKETAVGWVRVAAFEREQDEAAAGVPVIAVDPLPARLVAATLVGIALLMFVIGLLTATGTAIQLAFAAFLLLIGVIVFFVAGRDAHH